jgi:hypothetical protein
MWETLDRRVSRRRSERPKHPVWRVFAFSVVSWLRNIARSRSCPFCRSPAVASDLTNGSCFAQGVSILYKVGRTIPQTVGLLYVLKLKEYLCTYSSDEKVKYKQVIT